MHLVDVYLFVFFPHNHFLGSEEVRKESIDDGSLFIFFSRVLKEKKDRALSDQRLYISNVRFRFARTCVCLCRRKRRICSSRSRLRPRSSSSQGSNYWIAIHRWVHPVSLDRCIILPVSHGYFSLLCIQNCKMSFFKK